jgi:hypothetical protein
MPKEDIQKMLEEAKKTGEFQGSVLQMLRDIKEENLNTGSKLASIETKLDSKADRSELTKVSDGLVTKVGKEEFAKVAEDVKILMGWRWYIIGAIAMGVFVIGLIK